MPIHPRSKKFLEELPKNGNKLLPSALKAGYSENYARGNARTILKTALKAQAQEVIDTIENKPGLTGKQIKPLMTDLIGITNQELMNNLKYILNQEKDISTRYKLVSALAKEHGIELGDNDEKVTVPILNITMEAPMATPSHITPIIIGDAIENIE